MALANDIVANKNGLLISEYYKPVTNHYDTIQRYIRRDRLQALFSDMVILVASYSEVDSKENKKNDSGSRHAMKKAKEYGIKRAVMYDENIVLNGMFNLNKEIIKEKFNGVLNKESIKKFNLDKSNRDIKIITKDNAESVIKRLKEWKENKEENKQLTLFDL